MNVSPNPSLILLPGLGADERLFRPQRELPFAVEVIRWPEPLSESETLANYAGRLAASIGPRPGAWVGGVSLGAVVALEAARCLNARGVVLIGGCTSHRQISPVFKLTLAAAALLPDRAIRESLRLAPAAFKLFERLTPEHRDLMTRMLREHSPRQIRWSCRALLRWECCALPVNVPVHAIHGAEDEVIPPGNVRAEQLVPAGRHLISLSHPDAVNAFLTRHVLGPDAAVAPRRDERGLPTPASASSMLKTD